MKRWYFDDPTHDIKRISVGIFIINLNSKYNVLLSTNASFRVLTLRCF